MNRPPQRSSQRSPQRSPQRSAQRSTQRLVLVTSSHGRPLLAALGAAWLLLTALAAPATARCGSTRPPKLTGAHDSELRWRLEAALRLAADRLDRRRECRALFDAFGGEGRALLEGAVFVAASLQALHCRRGAIAFTRVGGGPVGLCAHRFLGLDRRSAARTLIHEALHHAGQRENPPDPRAPRPGEIDEVVGRRCGL